MTAATGVTAMAVQAMTERMAAAKVASQIGIAISNTSLMECASSTSSPMLVAKVHCSGTEAR